ncbi:MAG: response regulator [Magnetospirillum sp.]|nr:response regulator [Magnetospirillum sp.]
MSGVNYALPLRSSMILLPNDARPFVPMTPHRILIVDDDPHLLAGLVRQIGDAFAVTTALNGMLAIEAVQAAMAAGRPFAVVVCDMRMPGMEGIEVLRRIQGIAPDTVRIMLTGDADRRTAVDAINRGNVFRYFVKPCPFDQLREGLQAGLDLYRRTLAEHVRSDRQAGQLQAARRDAAAKARALAATSAELEQFAKVAAHDLPEPLRTVAGYVQLLKRRYGEKLDGEAGEFIDFAVEGTLRMRQLFDDFLAYCEIDRGAPFTSTDMTAILHQTLARLRPQIAASGAVITHGALPRLEADKAQMLCLLQQLIGNAITYRRTGVAPTIHVEAVPMGPEWQFSVTDNGIGVAPEYQQRIFAIFERLHAGHDHQGTGIGLALCKKIVERHGGRLWVTSDDNSGSTFHFTLPGGHEDQA